MSELSPMMDQYMKIKDQYKDYILLYRVGDFYEMFYEDAVTVSKELEMTLTGKDCGSKERAPMCGMPYHAVDTYIARLVSNGHKVCICEQTEDPSKVKGRVVNRDIVKIITPGTVTDGDMLGTSANNYLASIIKKADDISVCFADVSTGEIYLSHIEKCDEQDVINEICKFSPAEILINDELVNHKNIISFCKERLGALVSVCDCSSALDDIYKALSIHFNVDNINDLNIETVSEYIALNVILSYIASTQKCDISYMNKLEVYAKSQFMELDLNTRRNLEIVESMRHGKKQGSLISVIDKTKTSMGSRKMRSILERPLLKLNQINDRLNAVEELKTNIIIRDELVSYLKNINDIERLMTRFMLNSGSAKDLIAFKNTFEVLPKIRNNLSQFSSSLIKSLYKSIYEQNELFEEISNAIVDNPPFSVKDGGMIKPGYDDIVDENSTLMKNAKSIVLEIEQREKEKTGIKSLKIGYNRVFGYYIEVTKMYLDLVPETYIRKQTLANCERYITQELKELETRILYSSERLQAREYELFCNLRDKVRKKNVEVIATGNAIAMLDVLISFAVVAQQNDYVRPNVDMSDVIEITEGRHPVVETVLKDDFFVPNDTNLDCKDNRLVILTGPNMSGKSTYMRQNAMIILMAQIGSFVPAKSAHIGIVDKIFTRVGASDDLASGQSTFMLEMLEVANILKNATSKSFLVFDEIGRGTSTYDGMSIAKAVAEYVADKKKLGAKTLFATHYHELCELADTFDGIVNYNVAVKKRGDDIIFLKKIVPGGTDDSFGIEVAALAGVDSWIVKRAKDILKELETDGKVKIITKYESNDDQISMADFTSDEIINELKNIDVSTITPIESMSILYKLSNKAKG